MRPDVAFSIFVATWAVLMIAGFFLFHVNKNARFKRKYFPWFVVLVGVLFIAFVAGMGAPLEIPLFMAPVAALIAFLNVRGPASATLVEGRSSTRYSSRSWNTAPDAARNSIIENYIGRDFR